MSGLYNCKGVAVDFNSVNSEVRELLSYGSVCRSKRYRVAQIVVAVGVVKGDVVSDNFGSKFACRDFRTRSVSVNVTRVFGKPSSAVRSAYAERVVGGFEIEVGFEYQNAVKQYIERLIVAYAGKLDGILLGSGFASVNYGCVQFDQFSTVA